MPAVVYVVLRDCPGLMTAVSPECGTPSLFVQVTVSPTPIVTCCGENAKLAMETAAFAADGAALAVPAIASMRSAAAAAARRAARADTIRVMPAASPEFAALVGEAARFGLALSAEQVALCERYAEALIDRNTSVNLTAITAPADIAHKHFLDSWTALAVRRWTSRERVVDVGSGAGFPGLALRIARPSLRVTLVESVGKKARFLEEMTQLLGLGDVEVRNERAEVLAAQRRERFDVGTARAVGTLGQVVEYLLPFLRVGGDAIVWKGRVEHELDAAKRACAAVGGEIAAIVPTTALGVGDILPGRNLVVVRKTRATPTRYPRTAAEARRRPW